MSRAKSKEEVREEFINYLKRIAEEWLSYNKDTKEILEGFLFSVLSLFDGCSAYMPAFDIVVRPHPDDKQYAIDNDEDYYEDGMCINDDVHLHEDMKNSTLKEISKNE